ncbi:hypothetical protein N7456_006445 [Penicillium angulare]|uniref:RGS domain-containing protein n=1 Tax=Penicillium angulare TaxID=116970 RepID=A0A9W9KBX7_9EURO|nr:hypothetical protein N7456_006445 [Penicillium angulare]
MAAAMAGITIYNLPPSPVNYDRLGVFYISWCIIWTVLLISGMVFCVVNRHIPIIRVRGIQLSFPAIAMLHLYWILGQLVYPVGASMPTVLAYDVQYFGMGVWFPLGIALFQASNLRFLHVAKMQRQFIHPELRSERRCNGGKTSWLCRLRNMDYMKRTLIFIGIAMVVQFIITIAMWLMCKKYHPTYGIPGTEVKGATPQEQIVNLGQGWEWWQSVLWQVIWTWVAAPILIWKAWDIRDTMGWRTQTIACCLSGLLATPMFMIATYVPAFAKVNMYFPQSQWIHVSIMFWEIFTVFVPIFQVIQLWILKKKTNNSTSAHGSSSISTCMNDFSSNEWKNQSSSSSTLAEKGQATTTISRVEVDRMYTPDALDHVLNKSPEALQEFAARCEFSGENVAFLNEVSLWKCRWPAILAEEERPGAFNHALRIYGDYVSTHHAVFPLNISSQSYKQLQAVFESPARVLFGEGSINSTSPFDDVDLTLPSEEISGAYYTGEIPVSFDMTIFNEVQEHIKYLVLTNTWPKFVDSMRRRSVDSERSDFSNVSDASMRSWISKTRMKLQSFL